MVHARILLQKSNRQVDWVKTFDSIDSFNKYKDSKLEHSSFIKYSLRNDNEQMYSKSITEYGQVRNLNSKDMFSGVTENKVQRDSRNNHIALKGNKLINLNMTPSRIKSLTKFIETSPLTTKEVSILKSLFSCSKLTKGQYELIEDIKHRASRRVKL